MTLILHWLAMGGYAPYIWSAYGMMLAIIIFQRIALQKQRRAVKYSLRQWFKRHSA